MLALTAPRVIAKMAIYDRRLELDAKLYAKANDAITSAVGDEDRTRDELAQALARKNIVAKGQRLAHIVMRAELDGIICSGAPRGKRQTYAALERRAPDARLLDRDDAVRELVRRYFRSHGPATLKDFVWWSGLTGAMVKPALSDLERELETETIGGRTYWFDPAFAEVPVCKGVFDLVQIYDEIGIAYSESRDVMLGPQPKFAASQDQAILHTILRDGRYAGRWRLSTKGGTIDVELLPVKGISKRLLHDASQRFLSFMS
jgi:hypothetical protein